MDMNPFDATSPSALTGGSIAGGIQLLESTVLEKLVDSAEDGNILRTYGNVPEDVHKLLREQEGLLPECKRRKGKAPDDTPVVNAHPCCRVYDQDVADCNAGSHSEVKEVAAQRRLAALIISNPRDGALMRYCQLPGGKVRGATRKRASYMHI